MHLKLDRPIIVMLILLFICVVMINYLLALIGEPRAVWFYCLFDALKVCADAR